ncbi:class II aldolase/adducin family protein, partial [Escherichia coli]|uniref:class II aldolase/adducin family protein n=1 Tax=Escherichia coli TaxID=562 RepID=UPI002024ACF7
IFRRAVRNTPRASHPLLSKASADLSSFFPSCRNDHLPTGLSEEEVQGEYELNTGKVIIETLGNAEPLHTPGIVVYQHGPFAWGKDAHDAVHNAVVMEEVAKMAWIARSINPQLNHIDSYLMNKHFMRKHGPNAYYGQK